MNFASRDLVRFFLILGIMTLLEPKIKAQTNIKIPHSWIRNKHLDKNAFRQPWQGNSFIKYTDGSVFIGNQLSVKQSVLKFRLNTNDTINVPLDFVKYIYGPDDIILFKDGKFHSKSGFFLTIANGYGLNSDFSVQLISYVGYRFKERYAVGIAVGIESHEAYYGGLYLWDEFYSFSAFGRYYLNENRRRVFASMRIGNGYALPEWNGESHTGGLIIEPGLGVIFPSRNHGKFLLKLNQCFQYTEGQMLEWDVLQNSIYTKYDIWYQRLMLTFGWEFH